MEISEVPHIDIEERKGGVLLARFVTGELGLFESPIAEDLANLVDRAERDDAVTAVVLTGTHPERFLSHASVDWLQRGGAASPAVGVKTASKIVTLGAAVKKSGLPDGATSRTPLWGVLELERLHQTLLKMNSSGVIYAAAMNGSALGFGSELAWACDLRLMAEGDHFLGQPEILLGFNPGGGGTQRLARLVGDHRALLAMLDGGPIEATEALRIGALDGIVSPDQLLETTIEEAARLGARPRGAIAAIKRAVYFGGSMPLSEGIRLEQAEFLSVLAGEEAQERMLAYEAASASIGELQLYTDDYRASMASGRLPATSAGSGEGRS